MLSLHINLTLAAAALLRTVVRILLANRDLLPYLISRIVESAAIVRVTRCGITARLIHKHCIAIKHIDCPRLLFA